MADPLTGKFFTAYVSDAEQERYVNPPTRIVEYTGQVRSRVRDGVYLVKLMNALDLHLTGAVHFDKQIMAAVERMQDWEFFDSREDWESKYAAYAKAVSGYGFEVKR